MTQPASLLQILVRGAGVALLTQTVGVGITYLSQVLFARWMGATEFGVFEYVSTISLVLGFVGGLGLSSVALRFMSAYSVQQDWGRLRGVIWGSWWQTALASVGLAVLGTGLLGWRQTQSPIEHLASILLGLWAVPLVALMKLQLEMGRAIQRIGLAYAPSLVMYPLMLLLGAVIWVLINQSLTSAVVLGISLWTMLSVLAIQLLLLRQGFVPEIHTAKPVYAIRQWLQVALPLLFIDGSFMVLNQTDTLMIGAMLNPESVGIYSAAFKTAGWVNFILASVNAIAAPMFASLYAQGKQAELQQLVSTIARWMFYPALAVAVGLTLFAEPILGLFGPEFTAAKWAMMVLAIGQLVNVGAGSVGYLLNMTGHHNQCAFVVGCSAVLNLGLNWIGIPWLGILGAALATAICMSLWNVWLNRLVVKYLNIDPSIVAALRG
ncbi:MAG: flippase [Cyanobacteria bacterium RM1_2_2]|nr:flippase [Cyanobacteria bacterium RM1_2_2]